MLLDQMLLDESVQNVTEPTTCTSKEHLEHLDEQDFEEYSRNIIKCP